MLATACDLEELYIEVRKNSIFNRLQPRLYRKWNRKRGNGIKLVIVPDIASLSRSSSKWWSGGRFFFGGGGLVFGGSGIGRVYADVMLAAHTLWQLTVAMDPSQVNLGAAQSPVLTVVVQKP
jgi:hypothetical protein